MIAWGLVAVAFAGPQWAVEGASEPLANLADAAWEAGVACAGREAKHGGVVPIEVVPMAEYAGRARIGNAGLERIELAAKDLQRSGERVLLHEIAHAWSNRSPSLLKEGGAEILADCMAVRMGRPELRAYNGDLLQLEFTGGLATWGPAAWFPYEGYAAAHAWMREMAAEVGLPALVPAEPFRDWAAVRAAFAGRSDRVDALLAVAELPDPEAELADADADNVRAFVEHLHGTSDAAFDTDGDGWADAIEVQAFPSHAMRIPADATWRCRRYPAGAALQMVDAIGPTSVSLPVHPATDRVVGGVGRNVVVWSDVATPDPACLESEGVVWVLGGSVPASWRETLGAWSWGDPRHPIVVILGSQATAVTPAAVLVGDSDVRWAAKAGRQDFLLALVEILAAAHDVGEPPDEAILNDQLGVKFGYGLHHVDLGG